MKMRAKYREGDVVLLKAIVTEVRAFNFERKEDGSFKYHRPTEFAYTLKMVGKGWPPFEEEIGMRESDIFKLSEDDNKEENEDV